MRDVYPAEAVARELLRQRSIEYNEIEDGIEFYATAQSGVKEFPCVFNFSASADADVVISVFAAEFSAIDSGSVTQAVNSINGDMPRGALVYDPRAGHVYVRLHAQVAPSVCGLAELLDAALTQMHEYEAVLREVEAGIVSPDDAAAMAAYLHAPYLASSRPTFVPDPPHQKVNWDIVGPRWREGAELAARFIRAHGTAARALEWWAAVQKAEDEEMGMPAVAWLSMGVHAAHEEARRILRIAAGLERSPLETEQPMDQA